MRGSYGKTGRARALLRRLAECRVVLNYDWPQCAAKLRRSAEHLEALTREYPEFWEEAKAAGFAGLKEESLVESVVVLRKQLRHDDEKVKRDGAGKLASMMIRTWPKAPAKPEPSRASGRDVDLIEYAMRVGRLDEKALQNEIAAVDRQIEALRRKIVLTEARVAELGMACEAIDAGPGPPAEPRADRSERLPGMGDGHAGPSEVPAGNSAPGIAGVPGDA